MEDGPHNLGHKSSSLHITKIYCRVRQACREALPSLVVDLQVFVNASGDDSTRSIKEVGCDSVAIDIIPGAQIASANRTLPGSGLL